MRKRIIILALLASLSLAGGLAYRELVVGLPAPDALVRRASSGTTKILDRNGALLYEILDPLSGSRTRLQLADIPPYCQQATIATEDANFYTNPGVDVYAIVRAAWQNAQAGQVVSGGSTLTQQVARLILMDYDERAERSLRRKLREASLAYRISRAYSKEAILTMYFNEVYYGQMAYGLEAAAQAYFGSHADKLDLAQCALLAGLPQWPAHYNPLINPDAARQRQRVVLGLMVEQGYITSQQAEQAAAEALSFKPAGPLLAPHFVSYVRNQLEAALGPEALTASELSITTTLDLGLQRAAEKAVRRHLADLGEHDVSNAAAIVLDPRTGEILAMVGSANYDDASIDGAVNVALALRQPGSAMKPILYAAAFERGWSPGDVVYDVPTTFIDESGEIYVPANYDNLYHGPVSLRHALGNSYNLPAVILQKRVGTADFLELARRFGLDTLAGTRRYGLTLTLGGGEVRLIDLAAAYGVLATGGYGVTPCAISGVSGCRLQVSSVEPLLSGLVCPSPETSLGKLGMILNIEPETVLDPRAAYLVTDILSDNEAREEQFGRFSPLRLPFPAAAKTGTTTYWRDNWTLGYTPQRVVGVWVGNANGQPMSAISGVDGAGPIWHDLMLAAHEQLAAGPFDEPAGIERREVCITNGLQPGADCPYRRTELYLEESQVRPVETEYTRVDGQLVWRAPAELRDWARQNQVPFVVTELDAGRVSPGHLVTLSSPASGTHLQIDPHRPLPTQQIEIAAMVDDEAHTGRVEFLVDSAPFGNGVLWASVSTAPYRAWWSLEPGEHRFVAVAVDHQGARWPSQAVSVVVEGGKTK
ncbi:MAG: transglycosylase domain-containing protein [Thermoflexales bacterium]|nr:transglycosylase domain-containing protein [Thermoflexales bacterium]